MPRRATCARSGSPTNPTLALVAYNCGNAGAACQAASAGYAEQVLATAASYTAPGAGVPSGVQAAVVSYAESQIGTPYVYGGDDAPERVRLLRAGCLGLWTGRGGRAPGGERPVARRAPRGARVTLVPGDLVFFGSGDYADHVGIYIGDSAMVDAPYTGADVRVDTIPLVAGAAWGAGLVVLGAADPVAT